MFLYTVLFKENESFQFDTFIVIVYTLVPEEIKISNKQILFFTAMYLEQKNDRPV
jgi:hypothetical protein